MWGWQTVLGLLAIAWALQCAGTLVQVRRYRDAFRELSTTWSDGWMGVGKGGGALRGAALVLLVVGPDDRLRRVVTIRGRTVFARAERLDHLEGRSVEALRREAEATSRSPLSAALLSALSQVEGVRRAQDARAETEAANETETWRTATA